MTFLPIRAAPVHLQRLALEIAIKAQSQNLEWLNISSIPCPWTQNDPRSSHSPTHSITRDQVAPEFLGHYVAESIPPKTSEQLPRDPFKIGLNSSFPVKVSLCCFKRNTIAKTFAFPERRSSTLIHTVCFE